ncbi:bifunctional DNA primase/polymerase [Streptomyces sp. NPDC049879]|uniref:bifunctional DNA primase/polymerase n=1 Tax=Streptomyces sp. NPDC049879 TaxID=3365598 RepID=UPI0037B47FDF
MALSDAQALVRRGLAVFRIPTDSRVPEPGWQQQLVTTGDETALPGMLGGDANFGVACRASRLVVLDLDTHHADGPARNGIETLRTQLDIRGLTDWPRTLAVMTPGGGIHLYFRVPPDCTIASISGGRSPLGPGIDVRGPGRRSGGYVVGPGSRIRGRPYLLAWDLPVAPLPGWIATLLTSRGPR